MRFYNNIDLYEIGEYEELADRLSEVKYSPTCLPDRQEYPHQIEQVSISSYHIHVDLPLFSNPIFETEFKKAYRVGYVSARTPFQLVIHLNQTSFFVHEVKQDLAKTFDEIMNKITSGSSVKVLIIPIQVKLSKAS